MLLYFECYERKRNKNNNSMNLASGACRRNKNYMSIHLTNHKPFSPETEQKSRQNVTYIDDLSCFDVYLAQKPGFHIIVSVVRIVSVASSGEKTTEATETILAMNWFPLNRLHRI